MLCVAFTPRPRNQATPSVLDEGLGSASRGSCGLRPGFDTHGLMPTHQTVFPRKRTDCMLMTRSKTTLRFVVKLGLSPFRVMRYDQPQGVRNLAISSAPRARTRSYDQWARERPPPPGGTRRTRLPSSSDAKGKGKCSGGSFIGGAPRRSTRTPRVPVGFLPSRS